jgi:exopolysaccharide biosynthesis predicted pyruvyltransferase EpsI/nitroreductase
LFISFLREETKLSKRIIWVGLFPREGNCVGDHAQIIAIQKFLEKHFSDYEIAKFYRADIQENWEKFVNEVKPDDLLLIQSGGDFGSFRGTWHKTRKEIISTFPNNKIVQLPIDILYKPGDWASFEEDKAFFPLRNFLLLCRNPVNYRTLRENFGCKVLFLPDFVLSLKPSLEDKPRKGSLLVLRKDGESKFKVRLLYRGVNKISRLSKPLGLSVRKFVTAFHMFYRIFIEFHIRRQMKKIASPVTVKEVQISDRNITEVDREQYVNAVLNYYRGFKFVVTDRFHGMVFSILTGTPCVVLPCRFPNKMVGYKELVPKNVKFVDNIRQVSDAVREVLSVQCDTKDFSSYFDKARDMILNGFSDETVSEPTADSSPDDLLKLIIKRRSYRSWLDKTVEAEKIIKIVKAGVHAPSAMSSQAVRFKVITDKSMVKFLSQHTSAWFKHSIPSVIIMVFYDLKKLPSSRKFGESFVSFAQRFVWQDTSCSMQNMMLMCEALGLKSCWSSVLPNHVAEIAQKLQLPKHLFLTCMLFAGYSNQKINPKKVLHLGHLVDRDESTFILNEVTA